MPEQKFVLKHIIALLSFIICNDRIYAFAVLIRKRDVCTINMPIFADLFKLTHCYHKGSEHYLVAFYDKLSAATGLFFRHPDLHGSSVQVKFCCMSILLFTCCLFDLYLKKNVRFLNCKLRHTNFGINYCVLILPLIELHLHKETL